jgi:colanic acid/amylovoran biosynthesis glycosyltransferase
VTLPRIAYILLWFPKPSETFIFREVVDLWKMGAPVTVYTLYGELRKKLSPEMASVSHKVKRLGIPFLLRLFKDLHYWWGRDRRTTLQLFRTIPIRRWRSLEVGGENIWAFLCGFTLARLFQSDTIDHIHAPWANGPATAALVASKLTGIPYSFTGRAVDIYPPDGALEEKIRDASFVTTETMTNVPYLQQYAGSHLEKIRGIYNGVPLERFSEAAVPMKSPYRILALGRFDRIKAFHVLIRACGILKRRGVNFHLTLAGSGWRKWYYQYLGWICGISDRVSYPGYVTHDRVTELFGSSDLFVMASAIHRTGERDGLPTVILEAFMHRLPVVATDVCGIPEVVHDGVTGCLVRQNDPEMLAEGMIRMLGNREASLLMAEKGRELVSELFDPERNHRKILDLFVHTAAGRLDKGLVAGSRQ